MRNTLLPCFPLCGGAAGGRLWLWEGLGLLFGVNGTCPHLTGGGSVGGPTDFEKDAVAASGALGAMRSFLWGI